MAMLQIRTRASFASALIDECIGSNGLMSDNGHCGGNVWFTYSTSLAVSFESHS